MSHNLHKYFEVALGLVKDAGKLVRERIWIKKTVETKSSAIDFVTETDKQVEGILINGLKAEFADHEFIGEETVSEGKGSARLTNSPTWIIDPVDGTLNFVHGNPNVCISVGLFIEKKPQIGIIYVPVFDKLFTAISGEGAKLNGESIKASGVTALGDALISIEGGSSRDPAKMKSVVDNFNTFYPLVHGFRTSGSACYNMVCVALGAIDAYFEFGPHVWDMAAGSVIIQEAGGVLMDPSGGPFDIMSSRLLCASTNELGLQIAQKLIQFYPKRDDED